tara:strand:- start:2059 stop:2742 length:684 start_codon:yes stop_codon:yes gene_type:complete
MKEKVLIVGAGPGLSSSLARLCVSHNMQVVLVARNIEKLKKLKKEINVEIISCDCSNSKNVKELFMKTDKLIGAPNLVVFNAAYRPKRTSIIDLDSEEVQMAIQINCFGAYLVAKEAAKRMILKKKGSIFFTGATAGVKGFPNSSAFAIGKFGVRGLAQSLARELHPQNIHIAHFVIDGVIAKKPYGHLKFPTIDPDEIAKTYIQFHNQHKSAWTWEIELRTSEEKF